MTNGGCGFHSLSSGAKRSEVEGPRLNPHPTLPVGKGEGRKDKRRQSGSVCQLLGRRSGLILGYARGEASALVIFAFEIDVTRTDHVVHNFSELGRLIRF